MHPHDEPASIRSYQRIFKPDRRIYAVDGRPIPIPGGIPLAWVGYFAATLFAVLLLAGRSTVVAVALGAITGLSTLRLGGPLAAVLAAAAGFFAVPVLGGLIAMLDWPLRLLILPGLAATLAVQVTPDGRKAHRYAGTWLAFRLRRRRRSVGRPLAVAGQLAPYRPDLHVTPDHHGARLRRARVRGQGAIRFAEPMLTRRRRRQRYTVRPFVRTRLRGRDAIVDAVILAPGDVVEVRP